MNISIRKSHLIWFISILFISLIIFFIIFYLNINKSPQANSNTQNMTKTLEMGKVELNVKDLAKVQDFYQNKVGLGVLRSSPNSISLGRKDKTLVELYENKDLQIAPLTEAGLYHIAIVFESRNHLAETLNRMFRQIPNLYQGSSDHISTEAFYFADPEGNGVELYFDKPQSDWKFLPNGKPDMGSLPLDPDNFLQKYLPKSSSENSTTVTMGHVHLKIGNISAAKSFYIDILNFDEINNMPTALFISRDNYHHHLGMNTWESSNALPRTEGKYTGLRSFEIILKDQKAFDEIRSRVESSSFKKEKISEKEFVVFDPWNNKINLQLSI